LEHPESERILITGGAGYIGSVSHKKLLGLGMRWPSWTAFCLPILESKIFGSTRFLKVAKADIRDVASLRNTLPGVDFVIHLAAIANDPSASWIHTHAQVESGKLSALLDEAVKAGVKRFINISSIGVYGINFNNNATEEDALNPLTEYAFCKAKSEEVVKQYNGKLTTVSSDAGRSAAVSENAF